MRTRAARAAALAVAALLAAGAAAADPVEGYWQTQANDEGNFGVVRFAPCGTGYCATLVTSYRADGTEFASGNEGEVIVAGMIPRAGGRYGDGTIWDPGADRTYRSRMELKGETLDVAGCIAGGLICRSQTWRRLE